MEVRCSICGRGETVQKWSGEHEPMRQAEGIFVCDSCRQRVQQESLQATRIQKPI